MTAPTSYNSGDTFMLRSIEIRQTKIRISAKHYAKAGILEG